MVDPLRFALHVPNLAEPDEIVAIGVAAESSGWDGVLVWDHVYGAAAAPMPVSDPWVVLGALATSTRRVRLGTAVTPPARRRPEKLAREVATLDRLSHGRAVLGIGLGNPPDEYVAFGDTAEPRELAARTDEALDVLAGLWSGTSFDHAGDHYTARDVQFLPAPVQHPRVPVWVSCTTGGRAPLERAARWDGVILAALTDTGGIDPVAPKVVEHAVDVVSSRRDDRTAFDVAVVSPGVPDARRLDAYVAAGVTWILVTGWIDQLAAWSTTPPVP